jgi:DNA-binding MarR family transcriptional regulator
MNDSSAIRLRGYHDGTLGNAGPSLDECLAMGTTCACYNLRRASRAVSQVYDAYFEPVGLKSTQFTVLATLACESAGRPTVTELARTLVLEQSSLSRNLAVLEREGWVKLAPGTDKRERRVVLTRAGRAALGRGYPAWQAAQRALAASFDPRVFALQLRALRRLTKTAQAMRSGRSATKASSHANADLASLSIVPTRAGKSVPRGP